MAAAGGDTETQDLNFLLKLLGERGEDGQDLKEHTEHVSIFIFKHLSEIINHRFNTNITFRHYGSTAEDLKCPQARDIGDEDIVIFPNSDNLIIHGDLIEYIPTHPMHIRIRGVNHPILKSCLVEGTDYLATAALKNFHSAIYSSFPTHLVDFFTRTLEVMSREEIFNGIYEWKNSPTSPALTVDYARSNGSITEQINKQKDPRYLVNLDVSEGEWMAHDLCTARGIEYTKEHAQVITDVLQYVNEIQKSLKKTGLVGSPQSFPIIAQELLMSDRFETLKTRYRDIDRRTQNESRKTKYFPAVGERMNPEERVEPERFSNDTSEMKVIEGLEGILPLSTNESCVTPSIIGDNHSPNAENLYSFPGGSSIKSFRERDGYFSGKLLHKQTSEEGVENERNCEKTTSHSREKENQEQMPQSQPWTMQKQTISKMEDGNKDTQDEEFEKRVYDRWFKHLFETVNEPKTKACMKPVTKFKDTEKVQSHDIVGGFDFVPALRCQGWPKIAQDWIKQVRKWPSPQIVDRIVQEGFHLVVKPPKVGGHPEYDFRLSFSHAEYLLSQEMNSVQRDCYRCMKKFHRAYLSTAPEGLVTFHLKNLLLKTLEETDPGMWTESNRVFCLMKLFENLLQALLKKHLPHFFVRSYNLFGEDYIENSETLESLAERVERILERPVRFTRELLRHQEEEQKGGIKKKYIPSNKSVASANPVTEVEQRKKEDSLLKQEKKKTTSQSSTGKSSSLRYHDMKEMFVGTSNELLDMAFNKAAETGSLEALDPLERSLVEDLREINKKHGIPAVVFPMMFEGECWDMAYYRVWINTDPRMRHRMLDGIKSVIEMWKYILQQDDFGTGNEEAIFRQMVDPSSANPFDLSHVLPAGAGTQYLTRIVTNVKLRPYHRPQDTPCTDDIPLD